MAETEREDRWIQRFERTPDPAARLFCFPYAAGSASYYFPLSRAVDPALEINAVQYPGRHDRYREPPLDSVSALADRIFSAMLPRTDGRPFAFFGHSMGAVIAYEVTRRLARHGAELPGHLFVSARRAPSCLRPGVVHLRDDAGLADELRKLGGTDSSFFQDSALLESVLKVARGDYRAIESYRWQDDGMPFPVPITALVGDDDPNTTIDEAAAWAGHTAGEFELKVFPGGHFYVERNLSEVIATIALRTLSKAVDR